jgi:hypothetical protein
MMEANPEIGDDQLFYDRLRRADRDEFEFHGLEMGVRSYAVKHFRPQPAAGYRLLELPL